MFSHARESKAISVGVNPPCEIKCTHARESKSIEEWSGRLWMVIFSALCRVLISLGFKRGRSERKICFFRLPNLQV